MAATEVLTQINTPFEFDRTGFYQDPYIGARLEFQPETESQGNSNHPAAKYQHYLPTWDQNERYPPLEPFEFKDPGLDTDPSFPNLLAGNASVKDLTGNIGAEVFGVQLSKLCTKGKNELARFVAEKKVVAFRDQNFADLPIQEAVDYVSHFGRLHIHPTTGSPKGFPQVHVVHRSADDKSYEKFFNEHITSSDWHSDITYELQPPGPTFLYILDGPDAGGDTLFVNQVEAYNRLSPAFQERLHGLTAIHTGHNQAAESVAHGGVCKRQPSRHEHPVVRTHPVTKEKSLFVNSVFVHRIVQLKKEESEYLLGFLNDHLARGADFQVRVRWLPGTVVVWDNRATAHTSLIDWKDGQRRHLARITPQAERPYETPFKA